MINVLIKELKSIPGVKQVSVSVIEHTPVVQDITLTLHPVTLLGFGLYHWYVRRRAERLVQEYTPLDVLAAIREVSI